MKYNFIKASVEDHVLTITLARAEKRNAFTPTMINEIAEVISLANRETDVKLVVFKAEGPVFCAGMDLKVFKDSTLDDINPAIANKNVSLGEVMEQLEKPSLALVEGDVIAGAFLLIANCTYVYCNKAVRFRLPELELGIFPFQVMASLLKIMPEKKMLQLCLETDYFDADKAVAVGLVDGYLEEIEVVEFFERFKKFDTNALKAGIKAAKQLPKVKAEEQYDFLLRSLHELKEKTTFK